MTGIYLYMMSGGERVVYARVSLQSPWPKQWIVLRVTRLYDCYKPLYDRQRSPTISNSIHNLFRGCRVAGEPWRPRT